eukprot:TRINITY_DN3639_c0_g1_i2.p1 TRINITY_DN3639_c0_g1~~TRINITY_DN3639_c0_g1_i2.p1  ORF type:complete len:882 (-),score=193.02 TRINITY_DN3639_c0_g1_i2:78-2723(-)
MEYQLVSPNHLQSSDPPVIVHPYLKRYVSCLSRYRYLVVFIFFLVTCATGALSMSFIKNCTLEMNPPSGSESYTANDALTAQFPHKNPNAGTVIVSLRQLDGQSVLRADVRAFSRQLQKAVFDDEYKYSGLVDSFIGYYSELDLNISASLIAGQLVSPQNDTTIISITLRKLMWDQVAIDFSNDWLQDFVDAHALPGIAIELTGVPSFIPMMTKVAVSDMERADGIGLPIALLVMAWLLRSWRMVFLPLLAMGVSIAMTFGIMYFVSQSLSVMQATASLMTSLLIAMNVDYNLFLLSRYREEVILAHPDDQPLTEDDQGTLSHKLNLDTESGAIGSTQDSNEATVILGGGCITSDPMVIADAERIVGNVLATSGHTVATSGVTLCLCFLGLLLFKVDLMRAYGVACAVTLVCLLIVNLCCVPTVLLMGHGWFQKGFFRGKCCGKPTEHSHDPPKPFWEKLGRVLMRPFPACLALALAFGAAIPMAMHATDFDTSDSMAFDLPRGDSVTQTYMHLEDTFGQAVLTPYTLMIQSTTGNITYPQSNYDSIKTVLDSIVKHVPHTSVNDVSSPLYSQYGNATVLLPVEITSACLHSKDACKTACGKLSQTASLGDFLWYEMHQVVSADHTALLVTIQLHQIDALGNDGRAWLHNLRDQLKALEPRTNMQLSLTGTACGIAEVVDSVNEGFPLVAAATISVILVTLGVAFRSVLIPLRTVISGALTLVYVFAIVTFVYQDGIFDWTGAGALKTGAGAGQPGLMFMVPGISFQIIVGLSIDYDIFLLSRIMEYRDNGASNADAIVGGLASSGNIITAAGIIMAIAFCGMLLSIQPVLNQLSLFLVVAVLIDTFVVRILLVPPMMRLMGEANYWPRYRCGRPQESISD